MKGQSADDLNHVKQLMENFRYDEATQAADRFLQADSSNTAMLLLKSASLAAVNKYREARSVLVRVVRVDSANTRGWFNLSGIYRQLGNFGMAVFACNRAIALDPANRYFAQQLASLYYGNDEFEKAKNVLLPLYRSDTLDFYLVKQLGNCYAELKRPDSAIFCYSKALALYPSDAVVTGKLINLYVKIKMLQKGLDIADHYLLLDSANTGILQLSGFCRYLLKDYTGAELRFLQSAILGDDSRFSHKYLGLSYYKQERYEEAEPHFRQAFRMDTTDSEICFYYGVTAYRSMLTDTGLVYLNRTLRLLMPPTKFISALYTELAGAWNANHRSDTALVILKMAHDNDPANDLFLFRIAYQYDYFLNQPKEALAWYREYLHSFKDAAGDKLTPPPQVRAGTNPSERENGGNPGEEPAAGLNISHPYSNRDFAARRIEELQHQGKNNVR
ncbi:MAG: tetratricopeptide repeat protein [Bacteroidota bacterium]